jgi:hypothetical protein
LSRINAFCRTRLARYGLSAHGGTQNKAGIEPGPISLISKLPGANWNLLDDILEFESIAMTGV